MIYQFIFKHSSLCSIFLFGLISLFLQMIMVVSLNSYVKASANMKTTKKKVLLNLKNQFETIYDMDYQVRNTYAYVEKYLLKLKFMGFSYEVWERAPFILMGAVTLLAGGEAFYQYLNHGIGEQYVEILFAYGITLVCFFLGFHIFGVRNKKAQIQVQLVDYLENYLANRLLKNKNSNKILNASMEDAFMNEAVENAKIREEIIMEEKREEEASKREDKIFKKMETDTPYEKDLSEENISFENDLSEENVPFENDLSEEAESDMDMLRRLVREMEEKNSKQRRVDAAFAETASASDVDDPNLELLEEFVQSFLA